MSELTCKCAIALPQWRGGRPLCIICGLSMDDGAQPAAQEVEPSALAAEPRIVISDEVAMPQASGSIWLKQAASGQAGVCSCRHDISCSKAGETFLPVSAPASQPSADATFAENFFKFSMCAHSILKPECPSCLVGHAARMEMQLSKSEPQLRAELDETFDKYMVERARAEKAEAHLAAALSAPKAPAPLDLEKVAKEIDALANNWFHVNPAFSLGVREVLARHMGSGEASK